MLFSMSRFSICVCLCSHKPIVGEGRTWREQEKSQEGE